MGSPETAGENPTPQGMRWLELIGYSHLANQPTGYQLDGESVPVAEFDRLCAAHAGPVFAALEALPADDPRRPAYVGVAQRAFQAYFGAVEVGP